MNRGYTKEWYLDRIKAINRILPDCGISTDIMTGFCDENQEDHLETIDLMKKVQFDFAYMFCYSERPKTLAERKFIDNIPLKIKKERLAEVIKLQREHSLQSNRKSIGKVYEVLIEGPSKKSNENYCGRNSKNTMIVFPKTKNKKGEYVNVYIENCTAATLIGKII